MVTVTFIGNLGRDPELKSFDWGSVCEFSVAGATGYGDKKHTDWFRVSVFGKQGERCAEYLKKGDKVGVVGEMQVREYSKQDGTAGFSIDVKAYSVSFQTPKADPRQAPAAEPEATPAADPIPF